MIGGALLEVYGRATVQDIDLGRQWYPEVRRFVRRTAYKSGIPWHRVAAAMAVMSPRCRLAGNMIDVTNLVEAAPGPYNATGANLLKASRIIGGDFDALSGPKVRAFYRAIVGDSESVVLDTHMLGILMVRPYRNGREYDRLAEVVRAVAGFVGEHPRDLQAITWIVRRGAPW